MKRLVLLGLSFLLFSQGMLVTGAAGQAAILSHTGYFDSLGYYHVVGEVQNTGDGALDYVEITATFYDSGNTVVGTGYTFTDIDVVHAGQKSPFDLFLYDETQSAKVDHYELGIQFDPTGSLPIGLEILSHSKYVDSIDYTHVVGEVKNTGDMVAHYVQVVATFYDSNGKVVAESFTYTDPKDLAPQQKAPFDLFIDEERSRSVSSYSLEVDSNEYHGIPEFTSSILVLVMTMSLITFFSALQSKRRKAESKG